MMSYIRNIIDALLTTIEGLTITVSHLLRKPITVQYPDRTKRPVKEMLPERYRGFLKVDMGICIACSLCKQACPIDCIAIDIGKQGADRVITRFDVDISKCMFCGLCTEVCPTGAIHFTREFEKATPKINDLIFKFITDGPVVPYKKKLETRNKKQETNPPVPLFQRGDSL